MTYNPTTFVNNVTAYNAAEANKMGAGIQAAHALVDKVDVAASPASGLVLVGNGTIYSPRALLSTDMPTMVSRTLTASGNLAAADAGKMLELGGGSAATLTIQPNATVAVAVKALVTILVTGSGQWSFAPGSGVSLTARGIATTIKSAGQGAAISLYQSATDVWWAWGDLTA